jgi:hypothetical protein
MVITARVDPGSARGDIVETCSQGLGQRPSAQHAFDLQVSGSQGTRHRSHLSGQNSSCAVDATPVAPDGAGRATSMDRHGDEDTVTSCHRGHFVEERCIRAGCRVVLVEHTMIGQMPSDTTTVVSPAGLEPLQAVDRGALSGQRSQYSGPGSNPSLLVVRPQQSETPPGHLEHGGQRSRRSVDDCSHTLDPGAASDVDDLETGEYRDRCAARSQIRIQLQSTTHDTRPSPPSHDGDPLVTGSSCQRPEGSGCPSSDHSNGDDDATYVGPTSHSQHGQNERRGH